MRYFVVSEDELLDARPGLALVDRLDDGYTKQTWRVFGISQKADLLLAANAGLEEDVDVDGGETAVTVDEIAIALPFNGESLFLLTGEGVRVKRDEFAYRAGRDDVRTNYLRSHSGVSLTLGDFDTIALAEDDTYLDEFLKEYGVRSGAVAPEVVVERDTPSAAPARTPKTIEGNPPRLVAASRKTAHGMAVQQMDDFLR